MRPLLFGNKWGLNSQHKQKHLKQTTNPEHKTNYKPLSTVKLHTSSNKTKPKKLGGQCQEVQCSGPPHDFLF